MADRAGSKKTLSIPGASHVVMTSHPDEVAALITEAAQASAQ
jgi:pimeloyl-ACP methyl ester carboxylesterase